MDLYTCLPKVRRKDWKHEEGRNHSFIRSSVFIFVLFEGIYAPKSAKRLAGRFALLSGIEKTNDNPRMRVPPKGAHKEMRIIPVNHFRFIPLLNFARPSSIS